MSVGFFCIERMLLSDVSHEPELSFGVSEVFVMCGMLWHAGARTHRQTPVCVIPLRVIRRWLLAPGFNSFN